MLHRPEKGVDEWREREREGGRDIEGWHTVAAMLRHCTACREVKRVRGGAHAHQDTHTHARIKKKYNVIPW